MPTNNRVTRVRAPLSTFSKIMLVILGVISLVMAALGIMARVGLNLIDTSKYMMVLMALAVALATWGVGALVLRMKRRAAKIAVAAGIGVAVLLLLTLAGGYAAVFFNYIPSQYSEATAKDGTQLVIFRGYYYDQARVNSRHPTPDGADAQPETLDDYSYAFSAYPKKLGLFFQANAESEGEVYIGVDSEAKLMIDYPDETSARLYIQGAEAFDTGEFTVKWGK